MLQRWVWVGTVVLGLYRRWLRWLARSAARYDRRSIAASRRLIAASSSCFSSSRAASRRHRRGSGPRSNNFHLARVRAGRAVFVLVGDLCCALRALWR